MLNKVIFDKIPQFHAWIWLFFDAFPTCQRVFRGFTGFNRLFVSDRSDFLTFFSLFPIPLYLQAQLHKVSHSFFFLLSFFPILFSSSSSSSLPCFSFTAWNIKERREAGEQTASVNCVYIHVCVYVSRQITQTVMDVCMKTHKCRKGRSPHYVCFRLHRTCPPLDFLLSLSCTSRCLLSLHS